MNLALLVRILVLNHDEFPFDDLVKHIGSGNISRRHATAMELANLNPNATDYTNFGLADWIIRNVCINKILFKRSTVSLLKVFVDAGEDLLILPSTSRLILRRHLCAA